MGDTDGKLGQRRFFACALNYGIFVPSNMLHTPSTKKEIETHQLKKQAKKNKAYGRSLRPLAATSSSRSLTEGQPGASLGRSETSAVRGWDWSDTAAVSGEGQPGSPARMPSVADLAQTYADLGDELETVRKQRSLNAVLDDDDEMVNLPVATSIVDRHRQEE